MAAELWVVEYRLKHGGGCFRLHVCKETETRARQAMEVAPLLDVYEYQIRHFVPEEVMQEALIAQSGQRDAMKAAEIPAPEEIQLPRVGLRGLI